MLTAQSLVDRSLRAFGPREAVVDGPRRLTYAELRERSARLANVLAAAGAGPQRPVATYLPNVLEFVEVDVACTRAGMTRVGVGDRLSADECRYILGDTRAAVLVTDAELLERVADELPDTLELVLVVGTGQPAAAGAVRALGYERALADASPELTAAPAAAEDPNYILYTSGTTGRPKGATHTQGSRVAATANMLAGELRLDRGATMLHAGPVTHGSGSKIITFLAAGGRNVILPRFAPDAFADAIEHEGATHSFVVPTMLQRLLEAGPDVVAAVARMRQISFGGAPITPALLRRALEGFGPILTQVYGSCEAPHPITVLHGEDYAAADDDRVLMSAGRAAPSVEIAVVDDDERPVAPGTVGELHIRAPHVMRGYWENAEATAAAFTADGWYRAGDLAVLDDDGLLTFHDRKRDLIISGGLNVYPLEVERVIAEHPGVRQVAVVGAPDDEWGEAVVAYVVPADDAVSEREVIAWTRERLASYKKPQRVIMRPSLPTGSSNKVLKRELREALWEGRGRRVN